MTNGKKKTVIIGGGAAGPKVAAKLRRLDKDMIIDLYTDENVISYSACGLPYYVEGLITSIKKLIVRAPSEFRKQDVNINLLSRCVKIYPEEKKVDILNIKPSKKLGEIMDALHEAQLSGDVLTKEHAIEFVKKLV